MILLKLQKGDIKMNEKLSLILPCYNEQENVPLIYDALSQLLETLPYDYELLYINDGSSDQTQQEIDKVYQKDPEHVHFVNFSRNFGKEAAIYAGLQSATGDYVGLMDVDFQDPPEMIPTMMKAIKEEGYDMVGARRTSRDGEPKIRSFFARLFYKIINKISETEIVDGARDFRIMTRQMVDALLELSEYNRFSKGMFSWVGFKTKYLPYKNRDRMAGTTSWSFRQLLKYSMDGIISFSEFPLTLLSWIGGLSFIASSIALLVIIFRAVFFGNPTPGWPSMIVVLLLIGSILTLSLGIIGKYVGKIFLEVKNRPIYIIKEKK